MKFTALLALAVGVTTAAPATAGFENAVVHASRGGRATCVSGFFPVNATSTKNTKFNFTVPQDQAGLTQTFVSFVAAPSASFMQQIQGPKTTVSGVYNISGTFCQPAHSDNATEIQLLSHGVGFDRYYWDFAPGYSYVDAAADSGKATFLYDRLGVGQSEKPDPLLVVQGPLEAEILNTLAQQVRKGVFGKRSFGRVVGVGHSFGSLLTQSVTSQYPKTFDAAVLTGFSMDMTGLPAFVSGLNLAIAAQNSPSRFRALGPGYIVGNGAIANQIAFLHYPGFDGKIAQAANAQRATTTYGELFTQGQLASPAPLFTGPVLAVNGDADLPFCNADCGASLPINKADAAIAALYPFALTKASYLAKSAGHGLNLQYSAKDAYSYIQNFLQTHSS